MAASSVATRRKTAVESFGCAASAIGKVEAGMSLFAITRGQWSMIDAVLHVLDQVGPAKLSLWTWTVAEYEVQVLTRKSTFGDDSVRYIVNHSKIARIESEGGLKCLLRGSMNLNFNPRFEQFDITEGGADFDLVERIENEIPLLGDAATGKQVWAASRVGEAFEREQLALFKGLKVWAK